MHADDRRVLETWIRLIQQARALVRRNGEDDSVGFDCRERRHASVRPNDCAGRLERTTGKVLWQRDQPFKLLNAQWNQQARTVSSHAVGRGLGDCGTYEVHRLVDGRFRLVEFREKTECDGKATPPEQYKLVFRAN